MIKNGLLITLVLCALLMVNCQTQSVVTRPQTTQTFFKSRQPTQEAEVPPLGPLDDCLNHSFIYSRYDQLNTDCTLNYVHFYPESSLFRRLKKLRIKVASFNLFHLGDNQAPLKNRELLAHIMDQWDIIGVQELMPLPTDFAVSNRTISSLVQSTQEENDYYAKKLQVELPGYLHVLKELRQLDPSWALVLQSMPEGEGSSGEMAGFYYRSSVAQLKEWDYCPQDRSYDIKKQKPSPNVACLVQVPEEKWQLMSRRAFAVYFQSGEFDFIALSAHIRFRPVDEVLAQRQQASELCENHVTPAKCKPTKVDVGRYYEVKAMADQITSLQKASGDEDVIYMGDFNLELKSNSKPYWAAALTSIPGFDVFQTEPTTLVVSRNYLKSNYDHFIFDPQRTKECSTTSVRRFNFTAKKQESSELQKKLLESAKAENIQQLIQVRMAEIEKFAKAKINTKTSAITVDSLSAKEIEEYRARFERTVKRTQANHMGAMMELVSDHLPIEMECQTEE